MSRRRQPWGMPTGRRGYGKPLRPASVTYVRLFALTILLLLGGAFLVLTIFSHGLADFWLGPHPDPRQLAFFSARAQIGAIGVLVLELLGLLVWLLYVVEAVGTLLRRPAPPACPRCGATDAASGLRIAHQPVAGTGWETLTCPQCNHEWHGRL